VLNCQACGWLSDCVKCSAHMVLHKITEQKKELVLSSLRRNEACAKNVP
jgi:hypothetical protein